MEELDVQYMIIGIALVLGLIFLLFIVFKLYFLNRKLKKQRVQKILVNEDNEVITSNPESLELLRLEFDYAKETSIQAQQDRLTLVNFYLGLYAGVFTVGFGLKEFIGDDFEKFLPYAFFGLAFISFIFVIFIVRLRQAWVESMVVMNCIKDYFLDRDPNLGEYIKWTTKTLPRPEKFKTINFFSALLISMLGGLGVFMGGYILELELIYSIASGISYLLFSLWSYYWMLRLNI